MANTYTLISSVTVGSGGAANIEFTSIPSTYTDLKLVLSGRTTRDAAGEEIAFRVNGLSTSIYSARFLYVSGIVSSASETSQTRSYGGTIPASTATANTFGSLEMYIPNYAGSNNKSISFDSVWGSNSATLYEIWMDAYLIATSSAISSINIFTLNSGSFVQYSTAYLYGISNA
jgi:hypothetical protein